MRFFEVLAFVPNESQYRVVKALDKLVADRGVRLVIMVGDTIYAKESGGSGDDDFEWLTTYFQPYRTVIDRVPFYPCIGNHDTSEGFFEGLFIGEKQEDRLTLYDNLLVTPRFVSGLPPSREASISPGLFYRLRFGADVELTCLDTSKEKDLTSKRMFEFGVHEDWVDRVTVSGDQIKVEPVDWDGQPLPLFDVQKKALPSSSITVG